MRLTIDLAVRARDTGVMVRAWHPEHGRYLSVDVAWLDGPSLGEWLHSRGGCNRWAESTLMAAIGRHADDLNHPEDGQ